MKRTTAQRIEIESSELLSKLGLKGEITTINFVLNPNGIYDKTKVVMSADVVAD